MDDLEKELLDIRDDVIELKNDMSSIKSLRKYLAALAIASFSQIVAGIWIIAQMQATMTILISQQNTTNEIVFQIFEEQAKRTTTVYDAQEHMNNDDIHGRYQR